MGQPQEKRENKWISRGLKQGPRQTNLREKEKTNGLVGAKTGGGAGQLKDKREKKRLVVAKNRGWGRPT